MEFESVWWVVLLHLCIIWWFYTSLSRLISQSFLWSVDYLVQVAMKQCFGSGSARIRFISATRIWIRFRKRIRVAKIIQNYGKIFQKFNPNPKNIIYFWICYLMKRIWNTAEWSAPRGLTICELPRGLTIWNGLGTSSPSVDSRLRSYAGTACNIGIRIHTIFVLRSGFRLWILLL